MVDKNIYQADRETAWCPGCGNLPLRTALSEALSEMDLKPEEVTMFTGIGQAAKMPHYIKVNGFNGLHGRSIPPAVAMRVANPKMTVIVESGDGCTYGEGGNHILHNIRRNLDIIHLVHDNQIYGLTKGQASPTSMAELITPVQTHGVNAEPFNPVRFAVGMKASFVARSTVGDREHLKEMIKEAKKHKGYALIDIFQPCVSFNKINTYQWYNKRVYKLEDHDP
ncbi:MAG: 2-oxoglutarate ferredoxin oxidoreductase subunit beta, partial [Halanaerobium sp.]